MLNLDDLKQLINDEQKLTEKEQAIIDTEKAKANYYNEKANHERAQAQKLSNQIINKENKKQDILFFVGSLVSVFGIIAQLIILLLIML